ncbi:DUF927 domain-containing protein [bacterium]|nr:DUF927 domain-containing protein [bacterium]
MDTTIEENNFNRLKKFKKKQPAASAKQFDLDMAAKFLLALGGGKDEKFSFQTFDEVKSDKVKGLAQIIHGTFDECKQKLQELNSKGAGVFVTVNQTNLKGRTNNDIVGLRALFVDKDDGPLTNLPLKPSLLVRTGRGEHAYWLLDPKESISEFREAQTQLIKYLDTDKAPKDLARVMRVPGFCYNKEYRRGFIPTFEQIDLRKFKIKEILSFFPSNAKTSNSKDLDIIQTQKIPENFRNFYLRLPTEEGERNDTVLKLVREGLGYGISEHQLSTVIENYCSRSGLPEKEAFDILKRQAEQHKLDPFKSNLKRKEFEVSESGVFLIKTDKNGNEVPEWICDKLEIIAKTRDAQGCNWGHLAAWKDQDGTLHERAIPASLLAGENQQFIQMLLDRGLKISNNKKHREILADYIQRSDPEKRVRCVDQTGWHEGNFIFPTESFGVGVAGENETEKIILQTLATVQKKFKSKGTLKQWQDHVGKYCESNSRLVMAVSMAFAGPLLKVVGENGGGVHFYGGTSIGKTTMAFVGGSIWGGGDERGFIESWRATANGIESVAATHNDSLLILDEINEIDPSQLAQVAYMLANGAGKLRSTKLGGLRDRLEWRLIFHSTGERTLSELLRQGGRVIQGGQSVRMIDLPAAAESKLGVFENIHEFESSRVFANHLGQESRKYFGTPIRSFIELLVKEAQQLEPAIQKSREEFVFKVTPDGTENESPEISRIRDRFSLIAAAGELAIQFGVLPWKGGEAFNGVSKCYFDWIAERGGTGRADEEAALIQIRQFLQEYGNATRFPEFSSLKSSDTDSRFTRQAGVKLEKSVKRESQLVKETEWWIFTGVFKNEVCKGLSIRWVVELLASKGYLLKDENKGDPAPLRRIPGMGQARVYRISSKILEDEV